MAKKAIPVSQLTVIDKNSASALDPGIFCQGTVILLDKPAEWSSFHVVKYVRNRIPSPEDTRRKKKVGHAGTLDPLATGLLVLCTGSATRSISQIQQMEKTYAATLRFGSSTPSFDAATEPDLHAEWKHLTRENIGEMLVNQFTGEISQVPPVYSAIKVKGERLYKLARRGEDVEIKPRNVLIHKITITDFNLPEMKLLITCGKGTYIRSLAHDLGIALGSRAYLTELRRTSTGMYNVENAFTPEEFDLFLQKMKS